MASIERTAYPRFKPSLTADELQTLLQVPIIRLLRTNFCPAVAWGFDYTHMLEKYCSLSLPSALLCRSWASEASYWMAETRRRH
jgi:hypothetical protein